MILRIAREFAAARSRLAVGPRRGPLLPGRVFDHLAAQVLNALAGASTRPGASSCRRTCLSRRGRRSRPTRSQRRVARRPGSTTPERALPWLASDPERLAEAILQGVPYAADVLMLAGADPIYASAAPARLLAGARARAARRLVQLDRRRLGAPRRLDPARRALPRALGPHHVASRRPVPDREPRAAGGGEAAARRAPRDGGPPRPCSARRTRDGGRAAVEGPADPDPGRDERALRSAPRGRDGRAVRRGVGADDGGRGMVGAGLPVGRRALEEGRRVGRLVGSLLRPRRLEASARDWKRPVRFPPRAPLPRRAGDARHRLGRADRVDELPRALPLRAAPDRGRSGSGAAVPARGSSIPDYEERWETWAEINPESAASLGIQDRAWVRVASPQGAIVVRARVTPARRAGRRGDPASASASAPAGRWASGIGANPLQLLSPARDRSATCPISTRRRCRSPHRQRLVLSGERRA